LIAVEAVRRLDEPPAIDGAGVIVFGVLGMLANGAAVVAMLRAGSRQDLNLRGALAHTVVDVAGSAGVVAAGVLVAGFGWNRADPLIALGVAALCLWSARHLIAEPVRILLERAPAGLDPARVGPALCTVDGVVEVHDLHIWTITSGFDALAVHVVAAPGADQHALLHELQRFIEAEFGVTHTTIQVDRDHRAPLQIHRRGCEVGPRPRTAPPRLREDRS
jgi:cobalt-zinc-cadmium efflux system protein